MIVYHDLRIGGEYFFILLFFYLKSYKSHVFVEGFLVHN